MKVQKPLVSVIMPVYNAGDFLMEAIESILNQTYHNFELIIIDDCSTDNSLSIINSYKSKYPEKIKVVKTKKNLNCGGDRCANKGLKYAKGKYVARMDADDIAHPKRLEKQVAFLEKNPSIFLVGSDAYLIDKNGKVIGEKLEPQTNDKIYKAYYSYHPIIHPSSMYKRFQGNKPFIYQIGYKANNDYYTFFKLLCQGYKYANIKQKLIYYRIHYGNNTLLNMKTKFLNTLKVRLKMVFKYQYKPTINGVISTILQTMLLLILPEIVLRKLYILFQKGSLRV